MTQPPNPGQPYIPPASAPSAPGTYNPQQFAAPQNPQYAPVGAASQQPGPVPGGDSLFTNLFDVTRTFASKYGTIVMIVGTIGFALSWLYGAYNAGATSFSISGPDFDFGRFLIYLLVNAPWVCLEILGMRVVLEIAAKGGGPTGGRQF